MRRHGGELPESTAGLPIADWENVLYRTLMKFADSVGLEGIGTPLKREKFKLSVTMRKTRGLSTKKCFILGKKKIFLKEGYQCNTEEREESLEIEMLSLSVSLQFKFSISVLQP